METDLSKKVSWSSRFIFKFGGTFIFIGVALFFFSKYLIIEEIQGASASTEVKVDHLLWIYTGSSLFLLLAGILIAFVLFQRMIKPLKEVTSILDLASKGDFTQKMAMRSKGEFQFLNEAFIQMEENLKILLIRFREISMNVISASNQIQKSVEKVARSTSLQGEQTEKIIISTAGTKSSLQAISEGINGLLSVSDATSSSILQMGATIGEIANNTVGLSTAVETTSSSIIEITSSIKEVAANVGHLSATAEATAVAVNKIDYSVKEVEKNAKEAAQLSEKVSLDAHELGVRAIVKTIDGMKKIKETVEKSSKVINRLGKSSEEIGKVLTVIKEVTKQTNLLALNAAILASQAGEHGKGFTVVADEIKKLADRTASSTNEISQLINDVQTETKDAVNSIRNGYESVEEGMNLSLAAGDAVGKILESSKNSAMMARKIECSTIEQVKEIRQIKLAMETITSMSQEIVRATREQEKGGDQIMQATEKMRNITMNVRTSTQEQFQGSRQISEAVEHVNSKIQEIVKAIHEQKKGVEMSDASLTEIKNISYSHIHVANEMEHGVKLLVAQADLLREAFNQLKV